MTSRLEKVFDIFIPGQLKRSTKRHCMFVVEAGLESGQTDVLIEGWCTRDLRSLGLEAARIDLLPAETSFTSIIHLSALSILHLPGYYRLFILTLMISR